jgi:hypothetical protein
MKAWLITWEGTGKHADVLDRVAGILAPQWGAKRVADFVEFLYVRTCYNVEEIAYKYAKSGCFRPYTAEIGDWEIVSCGHNPHLVARKVKDLEVEVDADTELETITWTELARRNPLTGELEAEETAASYTRSITGPVSDRIRGKPTDRDGGMSRP